MTPPSGRAELEKHLQQSRRALPIQAVFAAVVATLAWGAQRWLALPPWIALLLAFVGGVGLAGDAFNVAYTRWRLRRTVQ
jgi:hypothetical protein